jgi:hypothetical protein
VEARANACESGAPEASSLELLEHSSSLEPPSHLVTNVDDTVSMIGITPNLAPLHHQNMLLVVITLELAGEIFEHHDAGEIDDLCTACSGPMHSANVFRKQVEGTPNPEFQSFLGLVEDQVHDRCPHNFLKTTEVL